MELFLHYIKKTCSSTVFKYVTHGYATKSDKVNDKQKMTYPQQVFLLTINIKPSNHSVHFSFDPPSPVACMPAIKHVVSRHMACAGFNLRADK